MKNLIFFLLASFLFATSALRAQVSETKRDMALGNNHALVIEIPQADDKLVAKVWNNYIKDFYKGKNKQLKSGGEILSDKLSIPALNPGGTVDLYALPEKAGSNVRFYLWVDLGKGFLNSTEYNDQYKDAENLLRRFAIEVSKEKTRVDLFNQEKELGNLEKELKRLQSDNAKYHKEIEDAKARIKKAEDNIAQNEKEQKAAEDKIETQKKNVEAVRKELKRL
jgi:valyl-tRNA synthetase